MRTSVSSSSLAASGIAREFGSHVVLAGVSLTVTPETRLGIVGPNGVGKSTLLRILAGLELPDAGTVERSPRTTTVGYLAQERARRTDQSASAYLLEATGVEAADRELEACAAALADGSTEAAEAYADALEIWQSLGAADFEARVGTVLAEVGLAPSILELPTAALSGGQSARLALGAVLLSRFDVTLLDEPTNDLDFEGLAQIERFVAEHRGGIVIVSHDRVFLEHTITSVLEIDEHDHSARLFRGGWISYLEERATARRHAEDAYEDYRAKRGELADRAQREREWASSGVTREKKKPKDNDRAQRDFRLNRTEQLASRARRTEQAIERLEQVDKPWEGWQLRFSISQAGRSGSIVVRLERAVAARGSFRLGPLDLEIGWGERVRIAGPNGAGKSTLLALLLGKIEPVEGTRWMGPSVVVGELGQERSAFDAPASVLQDFIATSGLRTSEARSLLAKFGLGAEQVERPSRSLSPGERTRAELATFQARGVNLLVLDEPTNHLDLPAVEQLEQALATYTGTLLLVSHDRRMLENIEISRVIDLGLPISAL